MVDLLKKQKMLEQLAKVEYMRKMQDQGADTETFKLLNVKSRNPGFGDISIYNELGKIPLVDQLQMAAENTEKYNDTAKESNKMLDESSEEERQRKLLNLFGRKGRV